jgi:hypothetical protein
MSKASDAAFLAEYEKEADWAESHGISQRTAARYRAVGLPFLTFGGVIWIAKREGREWIASRVKRRNSTRRQKRQAAIAAEIAAS